MAALGAEVAVMRSSMSVAFVNAVNTAIHRACGPHHAVRVSPSHEQYAPMLARESYALYSRSSMPAMYSVWRRAKLFSRSLEWVHWLRRHTHRLH